MTRPPIEEIEETARVFGTISGTSARTLIAYVKELEARFEEVNDARVQAVHKRLEARIFLESIGYRHCDAHACNCGSWHKVDK